MASTTEKLPGTVVTVDHSTYTAWGDLNSAKTENADGAYSYAPGSGDASYSEYLRLTNFGFNIPTNARIDGVIVRVKVRQTAWAGADIADNIVQLRKADTTVSSNRASTTKWGTSYTNISHGGSADKWGFATLTYSDVNNSGFGVEIRVKNSSYSYANALIDVVGITVYYTEGTDPETPPPEPGTQLVEGKFLYPKGHKMMLSGNSFNWETTPVKAVLLDNDYIYSEDDATLADVIGEEVSGAGYVTRGVELSTTNRYAAYNANTNLLTFHSNDLLFTNISCTFRSIVFYADVGSTDDTRPLILCVTRDANKTVTNANYTLELSDGLFGFDYSDTIGD